MGNSARVWLFSAAGFLTVATFAQNNGPTPALDGIATGKARVVDLSYAISDKMVPWPGDAKAFEAKTNATVEKNGYFTRSFWMLEHYGTHMDAPRIFRPARQRWIRSRRKSFLDPRWCWMRGKKPNATRITS